MHLRPQPQPHVAAATSVLNREMTVRKMENVSELRGKEAAETGRETRESHQSLVIFSSLVTSDEREKLDRDAPPIVHM